MYSKLLAASVLSIVLSMQACSSGGSGADTRADDDAALGPQSEVKLTVALPQRMQNLAIPVDVDVTVAGATHTMAKDNFTYYMDTQLPKDRSFPVFFAVRRASMV